MQAELGPSPHPPYLADVSVIGLVPDVWGSPWQARHHVLTRLATYFNVVWVNPVRHWRKLWRNPVPWGQGVD